MSYDLVFVRKAADQSWEDALDALEAAFEEVIEADTPPAPDEQAWQRIVAEVASLIPDATSYASDGFYTLEDEATGVELSLEADNASVTVPYWYRDSEAERIVRLLYALGAVVEQATDLVGYDPQVELPVAEAAAQPALAAKIFNDTVDLFGVRGVQTPANG